MQPSLLLLLVQARLNLLLVSNFQLIFLALA